jgi:hypothetical protein
VTKAVGADPHGWLANTASAVLWRRMSARMA